MKPLPLRSARFRAERLLRWRELDALIARVEREGIAALGPDELARLPTLHRNLLGSLSVARAIAMDRNLVDWLGNLAQRSFFVVYGTKRQLWSEAQRFLGSVFPRAFRALALHVALAAALLLVGAAAAFVATRADPERYYTFVDEKMAQGRDYTSSPEELRGVLFGPHDEGTLATFASLLFANNSRYALLCFALGFALGVPTFFLLVMTGMMFGAMSALYVDHGLGPEWFGWVLPHGITELFAICLCGAAGLSLGQAVAFPGEGTRREELSRRGRDAGTLAVGGVAALVVAAAIEGFFRQLCDSTDVRYAVASATTLAWIAWLWPRRRRVAAEATA